MVNCVNSRSLELKSAEFFGFSLYLESGDLGRV